MYASASEGDFEKSSPVPLRPVTTPYPTRLSPMPSRPTTSVREPMEVPMGADCAPSRGWKAGRNAMAEAERCNKCRNTTDLLSCQGCRGTSCKCRANRRKRGNLGAEP